MSYQRAFEMFTLTCLLGGAVNLWGESVLLPGCVNVTRGSVEMKLNTRILVKYKITPNRTSTQIRVGGLRRRLSHQNLPLFLFLSPDLYMKNVL